VTDFGFGYRRSRFEDGSRLILRVGYTLRPGDPAAIRARMNDLIARRRAKQPLEYPSAGSTFKRPEGYFAAALIDQCGLKGLTVGDAQVSEKHAGFIINRGKATCRDILTLADRVREAVLRQTGVTLELEIKTLGL
jgi:UDP-N-acetylmuramate dehydrogenase